MYDIYIYVYHITFVVDIVNNYTWMIDDVYIYSYIIII